MKTKAEMSTTIQLLGITKQFKPYQDPNDERERILLLCRNPARIVDSILIGNEICLQSNYFLIWTNKKRLVTALAKKHNLKYRIWDGRESELQVPFNLCDELLPLLGAKIKRKMSPEALVNAKSSLQKARVSIISSKNTG